MGTKYLIDTNAALDFMGGKLSEKARFEMFRIIDLEYFISVINHIELLSSPDISTEEERKLNLFINRAIEIPVDETIVKLAIALRRSYKLKLPDAVIAATALNFKHTLITRNEKDFSKIEGLKIVNPYTHWK
jgi:predicted nucleic acid-binding protein